MKLPLRREADSELHKALEQNLPEERKERLTHVLGELQCSTNKIRIQRCRTVPSNYIVLFFMGVPANSLILFTFGRKSVIKDKIVVTIRTNTFIKESGKQIFDTLCKFLLQEQRNDMHFIYNFLPYRIR